jgi:hypothetical protein
VPGAGFFNNNFISNGVLNNDITRFDVRVDHGFGAGRDNLFARYSFSQNDRVALPLLNDPVASGDFASDYLIRGQNAGVGWSRIFGSSLFSEFRAAYNGVRSDAVHPAFGTDSNAEYGIKGVPRDDRFFGGLPHMPISRFARLGGPFFRPQFQTSQVFQFAEHVTWTKGVHSMKFGVERRRDRVRYIDLRSLNGELSFTDGRYTDFGLGDFLLGLSSVQRLTLFHEPDLYADGWQVYAQDSWRVRDNLTVNAGVRYERFTPLFDESNLLTNIDPATGRVITAKDGSVYDRTLVNPDRNDIAPRVGVSWNPAARLVIRGGYGIFYQQMDRYGSEGQLGLNLPQLVDAAISANSGNDRPAFTFTEGFTPLNATTVNPAVVQWRIPDPNQNTPIVHQFSIGPEYQLTSTMVAAVEYVGSRTRNGRRLRNLNQGVLQPGSPVVCGHPRRLVGERHPHAERRPAVHGDRQRHGAHWRRPHHPGDVRRRSGARRVRPDVERLVRPRRLHRQRRRVLWQLRRQHLARPRFEVDEHEPVPLDRVGRRQARGAARRDLQPVQLGELRLPGRQRLEPGHLRHDHQHPGRSAGDAVGGQVLLLGAGGWGLGTRARRPPPVTASRLSRSKG